MNKTENKISYDRTNKETSSTKNRRRLFNIVVETIKTPRKEKIILGFGF